MIQSIYASVSNADVVPCGKKGKPVSSEPIPLLRNKYLGEYRTELEKAKVRKNLGIADEYSLQWGNIEGFVESQKDLVEYVEQKWHYTNTVSEDIKNVRDALDYTIHFVSTFKSDTESIQQLKEDVTTIYNSLDEIEKDLEDKKLSIDTLSSAMSEANNAIEQLNRDLASINVDKNILNWVKASTEQSKTITLENEQTLEVIIAEKEGNAIKIDNGLFVQDYSEDVAKIPQIEENVAILDTYKTTLTDETVAPNTIGGITEGTTVADLKGKTMTEILDTLLFPTTVRPLVAPTLKYSSLPALVAIGSEFLTPTLTFNPGDSGGELETVETVTDPHGSNSDNYSLLGTYTYTAKVSYAEGPYLVDNKGQITNIRVEAGSIQTTVKTTTTYPWYTAIKDGSNIPQELVAFGKGPELIVPLSDQAQVKLPGAKSRLDLFMADAGLGFLNVDMNGWEESEEIINDITYKVWTKKDKYSAILPHKIKFTLAL